MKETGKQTAAVWWIMAHGVLVARHHAHSPAQSSLPKQTPANFTSQDSCSQTCRALPTAAFPRLSSPPTNPSHRPTQQTHPTDTHTSTSPLIIHLNFQLYPIARCIYTHALRPQAHSSQPSTNSITPLPAPLSPQLVLLDDPPRELRKLALLISMPLILSHKPVSILYVSYTSTYHHTIDGPRR